MRNYISLALATTPSGLGSHCKHVGVPTRLKNRKPVTKQVRDGGRGGGEELQRVHKKHKYQISVRMQKRNTYNSKARVPVLRGGCVAARGCIMRPGYRLCLTEIGMRPGRCRWLALVQGPHAGMISLGDDCRGRSR